MARCYLHLNAEMRKVSKNKKDYILLLWLADESETMVDKYIGRGDMFILDDNGVKDDR